MNDSLETNIRLNQNKLERAKVSVINDGEEMVVFKCLRCVLLWGCGWYYFIGGGQWIRVGDTAARVNKKLLVHHD